MNAYTVKINAPEVTVWAKGFAQAKEKGLEKINKTLSYEVTIQKK